MKRIIRHGEQYTNAIFLRECCNCGCQFEYERKDVEKTYYDQRYDMEFWYMSCPECGDVTGFEKPEPIRYEQSKGEKQ